MRHKSSVAILLALLLTLALALPALAGNTGCPTDISTRLNDTTLDHSQGMTFTIVSKALRDEHSFYGHTGSTKRTAATDVAPLQAALDSLSAFLSGFTMHEETPLSDVLLVLNFCAHFIGEEPVIGVINSLLAAQPDPQGVYTSAPLTFPSGSDVVFAFDPSTGIFSMDVAGD